MKRAIIFGFVLAACSHAYGHAIGGAHGGVSGAAGGMRNGVGASLGKASSPGNGAGGGRYTLGDEYQPWPQAEMQRYAKPKFVPYSGGRHD